MVFIWPSNLYIKKPLKKCIYPKKSQEKIFSISQECVVPFLDLFELLCVKKKTKTIQTII